MGTGLDPEEVMAKAYGIAEGLTAGQRTDLVALGIISASMGDLVNGLRKEIEDDDSVTEFSSPILILAIQFLLISRECLESIQGVEIAGYKIPKIEVLDE